MGDLPYFLRNFRPDAVATRGDENVVIEVSARSTYEKDRQLGLLAEEVARHPGWKLEVVWVGSSVGAESAGLRLPSVDEIRSRSAEMRRLYDEGEHAGALLILWSLLEAASGHRLAEVDAEPRGPQTPIALVKDLVSFGHIDQEDYNRMKEIASLRNAIAHGHSTLRVDRKTFEHLVSVVDKMASQPTSEDAVN